MAFVLNLLPDWLRAQVVPLVHILSPQSGLSDNKRWNHTGLDITLNLDFYPPMLHSNLVQSKNISYVKCTDSKEIIRAKS